MARVANFKSPRRATRIGTNPTFFNILRTLAHDCAQRFRIQANPHHTFTIYADPPLSASRSPAPPAALIIVTRCLQLPLYLGLIAAQVIYVFHFRGELVHLIEPAFGSTTALQKLVTSIGHKSGAEVTALNETIIMLVVLALIVNASVPEGQARHRHHRLQLDRTAENVHQRRQ